jgi:hypothetical protein
MLIVNNVNVFQVHVYSGRNNDKREYKTYSSFSYFFLFFIKVVFIPNHLFFYILVIFILLHHIESKSFVQVDLFFPFSFHIVIYSQIKITSSSQSRKTGQLFSPILKAIQSEN